MDKSGIKMGGAILLACITLLLCTGLALAADNATTTGTINNGMSLDDTGSDDSIAYDNINISDVSNMSYANDVAINTPSGKIEAWSNAPVVLLNASGYENLTNWDNQTWYGSDTDNLTTDGFSLDTMVMDPNTDMSNMSIKVQYPNGNFSYVGNLRLEQVNGQWVLNADHAGVQYVDIEDETGANNSTYVWDGRPLGIPANVSDKPFYITLWSDNNLNL
jgi:hypothetical protein